MTDVWGYADLHCHPMSHLGFGGAGIAPTGRRLFWGLPDPPAPVEQPAAVSLPCCSAAHGVFSNPNLLPYFIEGHHGCGSPTYKDWPRYDTITHQQMYYEFMLRAHASGLRLICALAVHNRMLATLFGYAEGTDLRDSTAIRAQVAGMKAFADRHSTWVEVVTTPDAARAAIAQNKLAVVMGVEVDSLGDFRSESNCTDDQVDALVDELWAMGVRTSTPIHLANNAFGGCSIGADQFNLLNHFLGEGDGKHEFFRIREGGGTDGVKNLLDTDPARKLLLTAYMHLIRSHPDPNVEMDYPAYRSIRADGHRNVRGLTARGRRLVQRMMRRGMMVDVDHMSDASRDEVLDLAESRDYPVYSSHTTMRELGLDQSASTKAMKGVASEGALTRRALERIRDLGGVVAPITRQGPTKRFDPKIPTTPRTLDRDTSLSFSHAYLYALDVMGHDRVALGTDMNGFNQQPGPRLAGGRWTGPLRPVVYDAELEVQHQQVLKKYHLGNRTFDVNVDGLAHYGLLPDFLRDVANLMGAEDRLVPLYRSAQRFIEMWERCEARSLIP
ncbi:MAG TPA: membrane dipeptidase [Polyangiaceae bacterium]|jgi:microsomal dipeptidase-like Zn-dependent dipeptidase|nr:membrane dipeptidase [Polyangiaceae bacterium]